MALGRRGLDREIGVSVVGPAESRRLNAQYRGKDKPTNVLSFPVPQQPVTGPQPLGDLVICPQVLRTEAREQNKSLRAHWAHLVVHGSLHLIGYDHERDADADRMERREIAVLRRLGFANPYRSA
jgi:probable rRNA maturation factor